MIEIVKPELCRTEEQILFDAAKGMSAFLFQNRLDKAHIDYVKEIEKLRIDYEKNIEKLKAEQKEAIEKLCNNIFDDDK